MTDYFGSSLHTIESSIRLRQRNQDVLVLFERYPKRYNFDNKSDQAGIMKKQRISYVDPEEITDEAMRSEFELCRKRGTPRPESQAIRAHVPATFWSFANTWQTVFHEGVCEHAIKELCRVYVSHSVKCEYCGNQRSIQSRQKGLIEEDYVDLLNFENSERYDDRQKAALRYTQTII